MHFNPLSKSIHINVEYKIITLDIQNSVWFLITEGK